MPLVDYRSIGPVLIDNVPLLPADLTPDKLGYYYGSAQPSDLYYADTNGQLLLATHSGLYASVGKLTRTLVAPEAMWQADDDVSIQCALLYGQPTTCSDADFLAGVNIALVGAVGRWEAIFFRDVAQLSNGNYVLSHLLRGRFGSDFQAATHTLADTVIIGTQELSRCTRELIELSHIGTVKMVPRGQPVSTNTGLGGSIAMAGLALRPWAPVNPKVALAGGNLTFTWTRRDRTPNTLHDGDSDTPMSEVAEQYSFDCYWLDGDTLQLIKSVPVVNAATYTITSSELTAASATDKNLYVIFVSQISAVVGRGWPLIGNCYVE